MAISWLTKRQVKIEIQYKPCILPYNPCTHFIERPIYAQRLRDFFTPQLQQQQIFVLWGLGGIGYDTFPTSDSANPGAPILGSMDLRAC